MYSRYFLIGLVLLTHSFFSFSQIRERDSLPKPLDEVVVSANKFPEKKRNISQRIDKISASQIARFNAQNTGDLLTQTGNVFVQKSQQGGSSPAIRGFEASRVLLVVDGVRLNNLIYRSGHLQNVITIDQNMLESVEVLYGPASTLYGSDALGGVVHLRSKSPALAKDSSRMDVKNRSFLRYSTVNQEKTIHTDLNLGWKKFSWLQSYTFSEFGDVRMGKKYAGQFQDFGKRDSLIKQVNGIDTVVKNSNPYIQKYSGYAQWDITQKLLYQQSEKIKHLLNFQFSNTTNIPRYDRLQDKRNFGGAIGNTLRWAEWDYGPQKRFFAAYELSIEKTNWFDALNLNLNFQDLEESRIQRQYRTADRETRIEQVKVAGYVLDVRKKWENHELTTGIDGQLNSLKSKGTIKDVNTGTTTNLVDTRYPNGANTMNNFGVFAQHIFKFNGKRLILNDGVRLQYSSLYSTIADNSFRNLPYTRIEQINTALTGNIGLVYLPGTQTKISTNLSAGFRVPNVDDLAKIFESGTSGNIRQVVVPNPDIKPERTYNIDLGISQNFGKGLRIEASGFYTLFRNALVKAPFLFNGLDSIFYNGVKCQVLANNNANRAFLAGFTASVFAEIKEISISSSLTYTKGRFQTDPAKFSTVYEKQANGAYLLVSKQVSSRPLDHIPPVFGKTSVVFQHKNKRFELFALYNGWKYLDEYNADGEDNVQYATSKGSPAWYTLNIRTSVTTAKKWEIQMAVENILDRNYRTFSSGFTAPGRNFVFCIRHAM